MEGFELWTIIQKLRTVLEQLYLENSQKLLFHGWHHINFVSKKAIEFANSIGADAFIAESAALVHDINYIVEPNSEPEVGIDLRKDYLTKANYSLEEIEQIESIITESHSGTRTAKISKEGMALSDADTLFKALPTTPIIFASKYITENKVNIGKLTNKVSSEQNKLMESGIYFYTDLAKYKYLKWAETNLALWNNVNEALMDNDVVEMLEIANKTEIV
ncbi:MAG: HD domain-containing protein [Minisyncoccota bacterium]